MTTQSKSQKPPHVNGATLQSGPRYSIIPGNAGYDMRLTDLELRVLVCIGRHTNAQGWCSISQTKLATTLDKSRETINRAIAKLTKFGYLQKHDLRSSEHGKQRSNICVYRVLMDVAQPPEEIGPEHALEGDESDLVTPGSQGVVTQGSQGVVTPRSQHNDPFFNDPRHNDHTAEQVDGVFPKTHDASRELLESAERMALRLKELDRNWLLNRRLFYPQQYAHLSRLIAEYSAERIEAEYRQIILEPGSELRRQQINSWGYAKHRLAREYVDEARAA